MTQEKRTLSALNILTKWRAHFAGWQLGTRTKDDPESQAVRDHREVTLLLRAETSALLQVLLRKGLVTEVEFLASLEREANDLNHALEVRWPGVTASEDGLTYNPAKAMEWMKGWKP
jgi:hypothetical protein